MWPKSPSRHVHQPHAGIARHSSRAARPQVAFRQRGIAPDRRVDYAAPERWHEPTETSEVRYVVEAPGQGLIHAVTVDEIRNRLEELPSEFVEQIGVIQLSRLTRKLRQFPRYGMQWGPNIYLYPMEASLVERFAKPPRPEQEIESRMFGGKWIRRRGLWELHWTPATIRDFYLNNVLIHELGHVLDDRNSSYKARERYAIWFATEYGYRASRGRRPTAMDRQQPR